jgi:hypothetical protein
VVDGSPRRHQGLSRDLAAEGALTLLFGVLSAVRIDFDRFEVEEIHKEL